MADPKIMTQGPHLKHLADEEGYAILKQEVQTIMDSLGKQLATKPFDNLGDVRYLQGHIYGLNQVFVIVEDRVKKFTDALHAKEVKG